VDIGSMQLCKDPETAFMTTALKPGLYRFSFERGWPERLGVWCFFIGMAAAAVLLLSERTVSRAVRTILCSRQKANLRDGS
jgi:hypothetical protein